MWEVSESRVPDTLRALYPYTGYGDRGRGCMLPQHRWMWGEDQNGSLIPYPFWMEFSGVAGVGDYGFPGPCMPEMQVAERPSGLVQVGGLYNSGNETEWFIRLDPAAPLFREMQALAETWQIVHGAGGNGCPAELLDIYNVRCNRDLAKVRRWAKRFWRRWARAHEPVPAT